jgi:hypothetical protein
MPDTWSFKKLPGALLTPCTEDPQMALVGDFVPDWITVPATCPIKPGQRLRCAGVETGPCIVPGCNHNTLHYLLQDCPLRVCECAQTGQFFWYTKQAPAD